MTDTKTPESSAVVDDRTIQVASGSADLETDARRQAGFRFWTQLLSGERHEREAPRERGQVSQDRERLDESTNHRDPT
jgi:hypothetical protein